MRKIKKAFLIYLSVCARFAKFMKLVFPLALICIAEESRNENFFISLSKSGRRTINCSSSWCWLLSNSLDPQFRFQFAICNKFISISGLFFMFSPFSEHKKLIWWIFHFSSDEKCCKWSCRFALSFGCQAEKSVSSTNMSLTSILLGFLATFNTLKNAF